MKLTTSSHLVGPLLLALATASLAQNLSGEPACATACLSSAISAVGCSPTDLACQCAPSGQAAIGGAAAGCLIGSCTVASDLQSAIAAGSALCEGYSAALTGSVSSGSMTATGGATTSTETTRGFTGLVSSTSTTTVANNSTVRGEGSTTTAASEGTASSNTSTLRGGTSGTAGGVTTTATSAAASTSASASASKAGAAQGIVAGGMGGAVALFLGVVAAL